MTDSQANAEQLVPLVGCNNELEGQEIRSVVEAAGIPAFVFDKDTLGLGLNRADSRIGGVVVKVASSNRERALEALELSRIQSSRIDWSEIDVGEPTPEVLDVLDNRGLVHNTRRFVGVAGPVVGLFFLLLAVIGIILFFAL
ncbi:MAG: hypothetical protein VX641_02095 [Planctomycetota bacterium]|nr:hypothetical protein [Planctomycetota bacterium]